MSNANRCKVCWRTSPCEKHELKALASKAVPQAVYSPLKREPPPFNLVTFEARMKEINGAMGGLRATPYDRARRAASNFDELADRLDQLEIKHSDGDDDFDAPLELDNEDPMADPGRD